MSAQNRVLDTIQNDLHLMQEAGQEMAKAGESRAKELDAKMDRINDAVDQKYKTVESLQTNVESWMEDVNQVLAGMAKGRPGEDQAEIDENTRLFFNQVVDPRSHKEEGWKPSASETELYTNYSRGFEHYLRTGKQMTNDMTIGGDPQGGYWVDPALSGRMIQLIYETSPMREICGVQSISTDRLQGTLDLGEAAVGWVGETESRPTLTTPTVGEWEIPVRECYSQVRASENLLDDSMVDVASWLTQKIANKFMREENRTFVLGTGNKQPKGFTTYTYSTGAVTEANWSTKLEGMAAAAQTSITEGELIDFVTLLKPEYNMSARFAMRRETLGIIRKLNVSDMGTVFVPDFSQGMYGTILGYPISLLQDMDKMEAGKKALAFGNFSEGYQIVQRQGIRMLRDPYTMTPFIRFYATCRVGGDIVDFDAIKMLTMST